MFGYTMPVESLLTREQARVYRNYYCETCHQLRDGYGLVSTGIVSYEITFAAVLLNSVLEEGEVIPGSNAGRFCVLRHCSLSSRIMRDLAAYAVLVADNDLTDDRLDAPSLKSGLGLLVLNRAIEKAGAEHPDYREAIRSGYAALRAKEAEGCSDPVEMGAASAASMLDVLSAMLGPRFTPRLRAMFEAMGVWVYVMDAVEDLDEDFEAGTYNPFLCGRPGFKGGKAFVRDNIYAFTDAMGAAIGRVQAAYSELRGDLRCNAPILDNIIWQGVPLSAQKILKGDRTMSLSIRNMVNGRVNRGTPPA